MGRNCSCGGTWFHIGHGEGKGELQRFRKAPALFRGVLRLAPEDEPVFGLAGEKKEESHGVGEGILNDEKLVPAPFHMEGGGLKEAFSRLEAFARFDDGRFRCPVGGTIQFHVVPVDDAGIVGGDHQIRIELLFGEKEGARRGCPAGKLLQAGIGETAEGHLCPEKPGKHGRLQSRFIPDELLEARILQFGGASPDLPQDVRLTPGAVVESGKLPGSGESGQIQLQGRPQRHMTHGRVVPAEIHLPDLPVGVGPQEGGVVEVQLTPESGLSGGGESGPCRGNMRFDGDGIESDVQELGHVVMVQPAAFPAGHAPVVAHMTAVDVKVIAGHHGDPEIGKGDHGIEGKLLPQENAGLSSLCLFPAQPQPGTVKFVLPYLLVHDVSFFRAFSPRHAGTTCSSRRRKTDSSCTIT